MCLDVPPLALGPLCQITCTFFSVSVCLVRAAAPPLPGAGIVCRNVRHCLPELVQTAQPIHPGTRVHSEHQHAGFPICRAWHSCAPSAQQHSSRSLKHHDRSAFLLRLTELAVPLEVRVVVAEHHTIYRDSALEARPDHWRRSKARTLARAVQTRSTMLCFWFEVLSPRQGMQNK